MHYLFSRKDRILANLFIEQLITGIDIRDGDSIRLLRNRLLKALGSPGDRIQRQYLLRIIIKTWNAVRTGTPLKCLKRNYNEDFPEIL